MQCEQNSTIKRARRGPSSTLRKIRQNEHKVTGQCGSKLREQSFSFEETRAISKVSTFLSCQCTKQKLPVPLPYTKVMAQNCGFDI